MNTNVQHPLVGRQIHKAFISQNKEVIGFETDKGMVFGFCCGDCCSYTWIEHIENVSTLFDSLVLSAEDIPMPDLGYMTDKEVVAYYGFRITTAKGQCTIDFRNDSNGHYGGDIYWEPNSEKHVPEEAQSPRSALAFERALTEDF